MSKIHDWSRAYWRNASGDREFFLADDLNEDNVDEDTLCIYRNDHGDEVAYSLSETETVEHELPEDADEDAEPETEEVYVQGAKYVVTLNGEPLSGEDVEFRPEELVDEDGNFVEGPYPETAAFGTRALAREFSAQWRTQNGSPEDMGYTVEVDEVDPEAFEIGDLTEEELREGLDYDEVVAIAKAHDIKASQSHDDLAAQLSGEMEPELTQAAKESQEEEAEEAEAEAE